MRKLFSGNFIFITILSLIVLIGIILGAYFLFDNSDDKFIKSGYVINPLSDVSEKYFFNKDTGYHKNLSSMIEFNDADNKDVAILSDSFLHYDDESMSFLKNGAILDLDSINGKSAVKFYNITSSSIIESNNGKYLIKSSNGNIDISNFIGRINEDKYIVVGDLQLTVSGNAARIPGKYFEVVYVEEGIVNIENKDVKYQVITDGTSIRVGNNIVIDLGDKKITSSGKDVMSITSITIDGNENIEIVPVPLEEKSSEDNKENNGNGQGNNPNEDKNQGGQGGQNGEGNGGTGNENVNDDGEKDEIIVTLKDASIGSTNIDVTFDIMNALQDDKFSLRVVNLSTGRTVDMFASVISDVQIKVNLLTPKTKYLFTVIEEKTGSKYFQKILETNGFGIKLEKAYATDSSLAYNVIIDEDTDITNAKLTLYKYNEDTKQNEVVKTSYYDSSTGEEVFVPKIYNLNSLSGSMEGSYEVIFDGLDSDTIYTAVLDEFSVASSNFKDIYNLTLTSMTLKKTPEFTKMNVVQDTEKGAFDLSLGDVVDPDNAIIKYTYRIYDRATNALAVAPIEKSNASAISVKIGDGENMLSNNTNYYYKVIIEYFDNEKYIEYITSDSITFIMGDDPYITVEADNSKISYDRIAGTVYLTDNSCFISMPGREKCDGISSATFVVSKINSITGEPTTVYSRMADFTVDGDTIKFDFDVSGLEEGTSYNIDVRAILNNNLNGERVTLNHTDSSNRQITTKTLTSFYVTWDTVNYNSDSTHVIDAGVMFNVDEENNVGTLSPEESMNSIKLITVDLYEGNRINNINSILPLKTVSFNSSDIDIKKSFYDEVFEISSNGTFEYTLDNLKSLNESNKLSEYYTLVINAYYDSEKVNQVKLANNILAYQVNRFLLLDNIDEPELAIEQISNKASGYLFENLNNEGTIVGYKLLCAFDRAGMLLNMMEPQKINIYVYDNSGKKVSFYYKDSSGNLKLTSSLSSSLGDNNYVEQIIYINYGTDYNTTDSVMSRGNKYHVGFEIDVLSNGTSTVYPQVGPGKFNNYKEVDSQKETPNVKMYIAKSTENSIKYNYEIVDPDNALYQENDNYYFYYNIKDGEEQKIPLELVQDDNVKKFSGSLIINGLSNGDKYSLYYKKNVFKTGVFENDVLPYIDNEDDGERIFDGYYNATAKDENNNSIYNFKYEIINDQLKDNNVVIKILATDEIIDRIVNYKITFSDSKGNVLEKELWELNTCRGNDTSKRCMSVDYTELKNAGMKSTKNEENIIRVKVLAYYDNGLTGYEYKVGSLETDDYEYMIMQNNNTSASMGKYIAFNRAGSVSLWNSDLQVSKGYYVYTMNSQRITYKSRLNLSNNQVISYSSSSVGYVSNYGVLNPKMISIDEMSCDDNTFSFDSITPKLSASVGTRLLNGAVVNLSLSGLDLADFVRDTDGKYYVYVETWDNLESVGNNGVRVRPTVKAEINESNPFSVINALIDGVDYNKAYYYNVYVKMRKNNEDTLVQLFDASYTDRYEAKTYSFTSLSTGDVYSNLVVNYTTSKEKYGDRELNTKFNLIAYQNSYPFNYDLVYVFCERNDETCGVSEGNTNIFSRVINQVDVINGVVDTVDISEYNLEYGKDYRIYVAARMDYYDGGVLTKKDVILNVTRNIFKLNALSLPTFAITKNAFIYYDSSNEAGYGLDLKVNLNDPDRTIKGGKYKVKLLDESGNLSGIMQLTDENGEYYDVSSSNDYEFDAWISNKSVRFVGLNPDTKYTFVVYADVFLNNYSAESETQEEEGARKNTRVTESKTVYTVNNYGVAFGRDIIYSATSRSIVVTFLGGSSFENVMKVRYTIGLWDSEFNAATSAGVFDLVEDDKKFELFAGTDDWRFVIDPADMKNVLGQTYTVNMSFEVKLDDNHSKWLTSEDNSKFAGTVQYVED